MPAFPPLLWFRVLNSIIDFSPMIIEPETRVSEAIALMAKWGKGVLVGSATRVTGWLTEPDVVKLVASGVDWETRRICEVMQTSDISLKLSESADIELVLSLMQQHQLGLLPVLDEQGQIVGTVTPSGIFQALELQTAATNQITNIEHQQTLEALRESEERFRFLADTAPVLLWMSGADALCTFFNQYWLDFTGRTLGEELGNGWTEGVHPEDFQHCLTTYLSAFNTRQSFVMEYRLRRADGEYRWLLDKGVPRFTPNGIFAGYIGSCVDITEIKQVNTELQRRVAERTQALEEINRHLIDQICDHQQALLKLEISEARFRFLSEIIPQQVWIAQADGSIEDVNQRFLDYFGCTKEQILSWKWQQWKHPEDLPKCQEAWQKSIATGEPLEIESRWLRVSDNTYRWHLVRALPWRNQQGEIVNWFGTNTDIHDHVIAQKALAERVRFADFRAEIDRILSQSKCLADIMRGCTETIVQHLDVVFARIWMLNKQDNVLELQVSSGIYTHIDGAHSRVPLGQHKIGLIAQQGKPHVTNSVLTDPSISNKEWAQREGMTAFAGYALIVEGEILGVIAMFSRQALTECTIQALAIAADEIAIGIKRQLTEVALKQSEERFRNLVETSSDWVWEVDENAVYTYASPKVEEILGYAPQEILGKTPFELMPSEEAQRVASIFAPIAAAQQPFKCLENINIHRDGHLVVLETSGVPIFDGSGKFCGYRGIDRDITVRKITQEQLLRSEERFRLLIESVQDYAIYLLDPQGLVMSWNSGAEYMIGYQATEIIGQDFSCFFRPEDIDNAIPNQQLEITKAIGRHENEGVFVRKDGSHFWANCILTALYDDSGKLRGFSKVTRDITGRKLAEESLLRFRKAIQSTSDAVIIANSEGESIYVNPAFVQKYGYSLEELQAAGGAAVVFQQPQETEQILNTVMSGKSWRSETTMRSRSGSIIHVDLRSDAIKNATGQIIGKVCIHTDITQRKQVESDLWLRDRAIAASSNGIMIADITIPGEPIIYVNPAFERITGYSAAEVIGQSFRWLQHADINQAEIKQLSTAMQTGQASTVILRNLRKDGSLFWSQLNISPVCDQDGNLTHYIGIQTDITERKQLEEELKLTLEKEKELNELKSGFISMISHEFRTPLSTILSSSELLEHYRHKWTEEKQLTHLHRIQTAVKRMTDMLSDILFIGKVETGILDYKPASLDLVAYCRHVIEDVEQELNNQHLIDFTSQFEFIPANMDEKLLGHILHNLLSNALKYSPANSTIEFTLSCQNEQAIFAIKDQGIGIPETDLPHVFESFHRAQNVGNILGTGLGLAIVKNCVDLHKGEIAVASTLGVGTKFTVTLPLNRKRE